MTSPHSIGETTYGTKEQDMATGRTTTEQAAMAVDGVLGVTMSRRRALRLLGAASAAAVIAAAARPFPSLAATQLVATSSLNLRSKPRGNARVLRVIPEGGVVTKIGNGSNRYLKVVYDGTRGYAHLDYLTNQEGPNHGPGSGDPGQPGGVMATTTDVNLRSGPSTSNKVLRVLAPGTEVQVTDQLNSGFRYVVHQGLAGWVWDAYLGVPNGGDGGSGVQMTTTTSVNHRAEPSTSARVYAVIPANTKVFAMDFAQSGWVKVRYNGLTGYVRGDYLR